MKMANLKNGFWIVSSFVMASAILCCPTAYGQSSAGNAQSYSRNTVITASDLQADLAILRAGYEQLHPGLYRYNSKAEMDAKFEAVKQEFARNRTLVDAFLVLSKFAAQIKCGHTYPNFFNQKQVVAEALFQAQDRVPFYFRWLDDQMVVTEDFTPDRTLPRGTVIVSINGIQSTDILTRLMAVARADGANEAKRRSYLGVTGDSEYEAFDIYFPLFFPQISTGMKVVVRRPGEKKTELTVTALTFAERIAPIKSREAGRKGGAEVLFEWKYLSNGSALLRMPTWALYQSKWDWKAWLNARLDELAQKNSRALIIDLRGNEGGDDVGDEILKRIVPKGLKVSSDRRLVRYRETPKELNPYLDTWDESFKNWGDSAQELSEPWPTAPPVHYFALNRFTEDTPDEVTSSAAKPFRGKVFVLIDSSNSSATFQFARLINDNKLGLLVGEPSGGSLRGINGGAFFFLRLPGSQIEMDLPLIGTFPASPQPDSGLNPDVLVVPTIQDLSNGVDPALRKIGELLKRSTQ